MGGAEAVQILRKEHNYTGKIVAVTASVHKANQKHMKTTGCDGFIAKPIDDDFYEKVAVFLEKENG